MRTTLTLDDDVAAQLERLRKARDLSFKDVVNEALRVGLKELNAKPKKNKRPYEGRVHSGGKLLIEDVKEVLAIMDEEYDRKKLGY